MIAGKVFLGEEISLENAKNILGDYANSSNNKIITIEKIQKTVASFYEIKISDLSSSSRLRTIVRPRQVAMYLAKNLTLSSLPKIGKEFGNKNHATVIHAVKIVQDLMSSNPSTLQEIKTLEEKLSQN